MKGWVYIMSNYYEFRDAKVKIADALRLKGWDIIGYREDDSDSMTDYYSPASWEGIATKNGYVLVVDCNSNSNSGKAITRYNYNNEQQISNSSILDKIEKLKNMTVKRGASKQEEQTAIEKIAILQAKELPEVEKYIVIGSYPVYQINPPSMKWHVEKDNVILAKGTGILKYSELNRYNLEKDVATLDSIREGLRQYYNDPESLEKHSISTFADVESKRKLFQTFNNLMSKIDSTAGGMVGEGELETYETIITTEYKSENKAVETTNKEIKEGTCFMLKTGFNYGCFKGLVYQIEKITSYGMTAYKMNGKLNKLCKGQASRNNTFNISVEKLQKFIDAGSIAIVEIQEVKTPYQVEKCVKKVVKTVKKDKTPIKKETANKQTTTDKQPEVKQSQTMQTECKALHYDIKEDVDTRDNSKLYVVKIIEKLEYNAYIEVNKQMKEIGGYYSKFKRGFIFKQDPTEMLEDIAA